MSLNILPLSPQVSQILIGVSVCIVLIALVFAIIILFRDDKRITPNGKGAYDLNSTKVPVINEGKMLYDERELLAEILPEGESSISMESIGEEAVIPVVENTPIFMCTELQISPAVARRAQQIEISCKVTNRSAIADSYHAELRINGKEVSSQIVDLSPGATKKIIFLGTEQVPGNYIVELCSLKGSLIVSD